MGLKVSTTCELTFGGEQPGGRHPGRRRARRHPADVHDHRARPDDGRHQGDRDPVHRLPQRARVRQEPRAGRRPDPDADKTAPRVTIIHHPDVRRMLMLQKAYAEGMRALVLYTASLAGRGADRRPRRRADDAAAAGRATTCCCRWSRASAPSAPTSCSRCPCRRSAAPASCRTTRSSSTSGTPRSTPCTRAPPRSRAGPVLPQDRPRPGRGRCGRCSARSRRSPAGEDGNGRLKAERAALAEAAADVRGHGRGDDRLRARPRWSSPAEIYKVGLNTHPAAAGPRRPGHRLAARPAGRGGAPRAGPGAGPATRRSTRARWPRRGSSPRPCCPGWPSSARSSRRPRST